MKLLIHMCCAPCTVYPAGLLKNEGIELEGLFYNPNIHPIEEYEHRKQTVQQYSQITGLKVNYLDGFMQEKWEAFKGENDARCQMCYYIRLDKAAESAKNNGFDAFTTSLLVSPYQKHDLIKSIGEKAAEKYGVPFYYRDFREGYRQGQNEAREMGLYRQKYCGCIISYNERLEYLENKKNKKSLS